MTEPRTEAGRVRESFQRAFPAGSAVTGEHTLMTVERVRALNDVEDLLYDLVTAEAAAGPNALEREWSDWKSNNTHLTTEQFAAAMSFRNHLAAGPRDHEDEYDALARQMHESIAAGQSVDLTAKALRILAKASES